jgi:hypothetical protein
MTVFEIKLWMLFGVGVFCIFLGFDELYLKHARQDWVIADAHVRSITYLEKGRHPAEDRYQLEVSYRVHARDVTARLNNSGHPSFKVNDTISVKIDPDNSEHFVFNQTPVGASIAVMFLMGIAIMGFSLLRMRARRNSHCNRSGDGAETAMLINIRFGS